MGDYYASPTGSPANRGTLESPWSLAFALSSANTQVRPGDTILARGGTYAGSVNWTQSGTPTLPILLMPFAGERVTLDGAASNGAAPPGTLVLSGTNLRAYGLELTNSATQRDFGANTGPNPPGVRLNGAYSQGTGNKLIGCVVHDNANGVGAFDPAGDFEVRGCLIYHNGWEANDRGHGHGVYTQCPAGHAKSFVGNILFSGFGNGYQAYTAGGSLENLTFKDSIVFRSGYLSRQTHGDPSSNAYPESAQDITVGSPTAGLYAHNLTVDGNFFWGDFAVVTYPSSQVNVGLERVRGGSLSGNTAIQSVPGGTTVLQLQDVAGMTVARNTVYYNVYAPDGDGPPSGLTNTLLPQASKPAGLLVAYHPNAYLPGRGHVAVYNGGGAISAALDLSAMGLQAGQWFEVRDAQNYFGAPVLAATRYTGAAVTVPLNGTAVAQPVGADLPRTYSHTGSEFNAFVVVPYNYGGVNMARFLGGVKAGSTSVSAPVLLRKTADSTELTGVAAASVTASYRRQGAASVTFSASALAAVGSAYSSGGWFEADATNQPGTYRLDVPDAAFASGADWVIIAVKAPGAFMFYERFALEPQGASDVYASLPANFPSLAVTPGGAVTVGGYATGQGPDTLVWGAASRTLSAFGFTVATNAVQLASSQPGYAPAKAGDAMALTGGERTALASVILGDVTDTLGADVAATAATVAQNLDAKVSSRSTYAGGVVAGVTAPVTVGGYATGQGPDTLVWGAASRTLSAFGFTVATNAVQLASSQPGYAPAKAGDAMALTGGERTALASVILGDVTDTLGADVAATAATVAQNLDAKVSSRSTYSGGPIQVQGATS